MDGLTTYAQAVSYLNEMYDLLNREYFENTLSKPTITIQSTPRYFGHFASREDTWVSKTGCTHEINIGAGTLSRPIAEVTTTMLHEMVHYYNFVMGIRDCSRNNTYHNRRFKDAAEACGLIVKYSKNRGWASTSPSDKILRFVQGNKLCDIQISRNEISGLEGRNGSSTRKYVCPSCGMSVRATKVVRIACMDCNREMALVKVDLSLPFDVITLG